MAEFQSPYAARIAALIKEQEGLETAPMPQMFSPEELARRQAENQRNRQLGVLGELSGDRPLGDVGGKILKQAMGEQQRRLTEHGEYDPISGRLSVFPEYTRKQKTDRLAKEQARMTEMEARDYAKFLADRASDENRRLIAQMAAGQAGTYSFSGVDAAGKPILVHSKSGQFVQPGAKAGEFTPYTGEVRQRGAFEKETGKLEVAQQFGDRARKVIAKLNTPEAQEAFGTGVAGGTLALMADIPGQSYLQEQVFTPEQIEFRADVMEQGYQVAHDLAGAAMSYGERIRLKDFVPHPGDTARIVQDKMRSASRKYNEITQKLQAKRSVAGSSQGPGPGVQPGATAAQGGNVIKYDAQGNRQP